MMVTDQGRARVFEVQGSAADPYKVILADDSDFSSCSCPAFFYRTATAQDGGYCKHLRQVRLEVSAQRVSNDLGAPAGGLVELLQESMDAGYGMGVRVGRVLERTG